jgi:predicted glycosyltransferase involved in capsule biosynthesis
MIERRTIADLSGGISPGDITMVLCIRAHAGNPWVLERVKLMGRYYTPQPPILVLDFGSETDYAQKIKEMCDGCQYRLVAVPDFGIFSLAMARNIAFQNTTTDFVFFCDSDFFGERDLFQRLADTATALDMRCVVDIMLNPPAYHLSQSDTAAIEQELDLDIKSRRLRCLGWQLNYREFDREGEAFIAPYSNVFMVHRAMFSMVGGYDAGFRGHGSEDFEFLLRFSLHAMHLPVPDSPDTDLFSPWTKEFFSGRPYKGFRRLFELLAQPTESTGLKVFHLWHQRQRESDWYQNNDWKRTRLQESTSKYVASHPQLLGIDFLERPRKVLCLCKNKETWGYFVPLRLAGFQTIPIFSDDSETVRGVTRDLVEGKVDAVAIFNPYMKSHAGFSSVIANARQMGREVIVLERGALPGTVYYADDVSYTSAAFSPEAFATATFSSAELRRAAEYMETLRKGRETLEVMDTYEATEEKYLAFKTKKQRVCFVPLQLTDDMAVTMFVTGEQRYGEFVALLPTLIDGNKNILFMVKPHPLSGADDLTPRPNLVIAAREDNVHALLDIADVTLCYNSGVGLLSLIHGVATITLGNAFYNLSNAGCRAASAREGLESFLDGKVRPPDAALMQRIVAWFICRKYSSFIATDDIRVFGNTRKAHGYKDILVTEFRWGSHDYVLDRAKRRTPFSANSYAGSRIAIRSSDDMGAVNMGLSRDWKQLDKWAKKDYRLGHFEKAANLFLRAYHADPSKPNSLRMAAEAWWRAGKREQALAAQVQACGLLPSNKQAKRRLLTMKHPWLSAILSRAEMKVPT